ncbi:MAG: hypothetical protein ABMA64_40870, partial [Myxococcota bacterium]
GRGDGWEVGAGRDLAASVVLLPVDGARVEVGGESLAVSAFAGRRGITTSRTNVPLDTLLPAGGAAVDWTGAERRVHARGQAAAYQDLLALGAADVTTPVFGANGLAAIDVRPTESWWLGGQAVAAPQLRYEVLDNRAPAGTGVIQAADLQQLLVFTEVRASEQVRFGADVVRQRAVVVDTDLPVLDPNFFLAALRSDVALDRFGWLRLSASERLRGGRAETRLGAGADLDLGRPFLSVGGELTDVAGRDVFDDFALVDRALWRASVGWRARAFEVEAGASWFERSTVPVSGLPGDLSSSEPTRPTQLAPFVLEAQPIASARAFWATRGWFGGIDLEADLLRAPELRGFVQVGALWESRWSR